MNKNMLPKAFVYDGFTPFFCENPLVEFIKYHNSIYENKSPTKNKIHGSARMHPSSIIVYGMKYAREDDVIYRMFHQGNVVIEKNVLIGPMNTIVRAELDETRICKWVSIGSHNNIGHNSYISPRTMITTHVSIGGSSRIGTDCWVGMGAVINDHIRICHNTRIGAGSVVTRNINIPGTYYGTPAKRTGDYNGEL